MKRMCLALVAVAIGALVYYLAVVDIPKVLPAVSAPAPTPLPPQEIPLTIFDPPKPNPEAVEDVPPPRAK